MQEHLNNLCTKIGIDTFWEFNKGNQNEFWMHQALKLAKYAEEHGEVPVGAVAVKDNKIIALGWNQSLSNNDSTAHAEIMALRYAGKMLQNYRLSDVSLYVTLEPCAMCAGAMVHARISRLIYGATDLKTGAVNSVFNLLQHPKLNHNVISISGVLSKECSKILSDFFKQRRSSSRE